MSKEKIIKGVTDIKEQATKLGSDAAKTLSKVKGVVQVGLETSKAAAQKATETLNKNKIGDSLEKAGSGVNLFAKGARLASKGADALASSMETASEKLKKAGSNLKKPPTK